MNRYGNGCNLQKKKKSYSLYNLPAPRSPFPCPYFPFPNIKIQQFFFKFFYQSLENNGTIQAIKKNVRIYLQEVKNWRGGLALSVCVLAPNFGHLFSAPCYECWSKSLFSEKNFWPHVSYNPPIPGCLTCGTWNMWKHSEVSVSQCPLPSEVSMGYPPPHGLEGKQRQRMSNNLLFCFF